MPDDCLFDQVPNVPAVTTRQVINDRRPVLGAVILLQALAAISCSAAPIVLHDAAMDPATLEFRLTSPGRVPLLVSAAQTNLGPVTHLEQSASNASWNLGHLHVSLQIVAQGYLLGFTSAKPASLSWPVARPDASVQGWILPMFEGAYVPATDAPWLSFLANGGPLNTTADFLMPFLGWDCGDCTATFILTNPFNNEVRFSAPAGRLQAEIVHQFTRNNDVKQCACLIALTPHSPVAPAHLYRQWLRQNGPFVTLQDKIKRTPDAAKLIGAAHVYLWGDEPLAPGDVQDWKGFAAALQAKPEVWKLLKPEARKFAKKITATPWPDRYMKSQVLDDVNRLLLDSRFPFAQFPACLSNPTNWGDGISPKMIRELSAAGFDRLWLGAPSWDGFQRQPETVTLAKEMGYLIGPYDSYDSIHRPGDPDSWETAQFDQKLYDTGAIVRADGSKRAGFQKKGYSLSPAAARPYVEQRVTGLMKSFAANSWFMDCDGFGDYFDDYSPLHPATQWENLRQCADRMTWIADHFGAVLGTEGCSAGIASSVCFAHGVLTPVIGWGDPDLSDKKSKYYLGTYYPPNEPSVFFKTVPLKEEYRRLYYDPRFRLPLFQTVFHDAVIATHHWSTGTLKFSGVITNNELFELLYDVPPLYHLNLARFEEQKTGLKAYYDKFSPLHRQAALLPMTDFVWLTGDHLVQRTTFGDKLQLTADFRAQTLLVKSLATGQTRLLTP